LILAKEENTEVNGLPITIEKFKNGLVLEPYYLLIGQSIKE
jgi:hypothetical protein